MALESPSTSVVNSVCPTIATAPARGAPDAAPLAAIDAQAQRGGQPTAFKPEPVWGEAQAMGTHIAFATYTTPSVDRARATAIFGRATDEIRRIEALMTTWRPDTELSRLNAAAGKQAVKLSAETFFLVEESIRNGDLSGGTFDITFETLHGLWKFDEDLDPHPPTKEAVRARLSGVSYKHLELDRAASTARIKRAGTKVSLGGIAKGYAVDQATKILDEGGLRSFFVQAGGDLFARGTKPDGTGWQAGVRDPRGPENSFFAVLSLSDRAFSTAGDYARSYVVDGVRYHHIIDPRTGFPATASRSVTIWARTALQADGIDDAVFILGPKKGLELVESLDGVGAVIVDRDNKVWVSERLKPVLTLVRQPTDGV